MAASLSTRRFMLCLSCKGDGIHPMRMFLTGLYPNATLLTSLTPPLRTRRSQKFSSGKPLDIRWSYMTELVRDIGVSDSQLAPRSTGPRSGTGLLQNQSGWRPSWPKTLIPDSSAITKDDLVDPSRLSPDRSGEATSPAPATTGTSRASGWLEMVKGTNGTAPGMLLPALVERCVLVSGGRRPLDRRTGWARNR